MYYKRDLEKILIEEKDQFECVAIYGPRQVGKSTLVNFLYGDVFDYVSLDDIDELENALTNPKEFLKRHSYPVIIDEIQKAPNLLSLIKINIDNERLKCLKEDKKTSLMYILTGSNQFQLSQKISESLAGRVAIYNLYSFNQFENNNINDNLLKFNYEYFLEKEKRFKNNEASEDEIFKRIFNGGMPRYNINKESRETYFNSYIKTYIEKDVKDLISKGKEFTFKKFLRYIAYRNSCVLNYDSISKDVGIDVETVKRWISILVNSGIIYILNPFMANISKRITKSGKLYFMDTGFCAYLCGWQNYTQLKESVMAGQFFEDFIVSEVIKNFANNNKDLSSLYFYRDSDQKEIDLLYVEGNAITPIEIKKGINPYKPNKNFDVLSKYNMIIKKGIIIDNGYLVKELNDNAFIVPSYLI